MIHLYGVVEELEALPPVDGVGAEPLERRRIEGLELVVSRTALEGSDVTQAAVLSHANVVEALMARSGAVLPARFGHAFSDEHELAAAVRTKASALARGLTLVRGCVEFGLRVLGDDKAPENGSRELSGRDYMRARLAEEQARWRLAEELHEPLARLSRASARFGGASSDLLQSAYLVPRQEVDVFGEHVRRFEAAHPHLTIVCTGPWPPYTFAANGEEDA
ncbi:MAG: GvpL/GvpF family gas vesicle protein [Actinobacteria bacterium]|nr:MAG: GvpL/GvpF family gas vesicle protein [Actinomycetota bacterium]